MSVAASRKPVEPAPTVDEISATASLCDLDPESARLRALDDLDILDTPREEAFDRLTRLAQKLFNVPTALVSFIDAHRQWYKSSAGMAAGEVPRADSFCRHVIEREKPLVVEDATRHPLFAEHRFVVGEPYVRFYAGVALRSPEGQLVGSLCLIDYQPRSFGAEQLDLLSDLAHIAGDELELRRTASFDSLTGALSRRSFKTEAERSTSLALRHHHDLSVIAIDVDFFKSVNDVHGHGGGDLVLKLVVEACRSQLRNTDLLGRVGGEEFAVLLPNTGAKGALEVAERIRKAIARAFVTVAEKEVRVTASFGVAALDPKVREVDALLARADKALYEAKAEGRNRSVVWRDKDAPVQLQGRRVLKAGQILFNGRTSIMDCTVRRLSEDGASLDVSNTGSLPTRFELRIKADDFERQARMVERRERQIDVEFL